MMHIGLYGGTFNPIHNGHLVAAQSAAEALDLSGVVFIPSCIPPLKASDNLVSGADRLAMVQLAIAGNPLFSVSDFEVSREQKSYTIDTVRQLVGQYPPGTRLSFILGDDCAAKLHHWKGIDELRQLVRFVSINRLGTIPPAGTPPLETVAMPTMELSSTLLRQRLGERKPVRYLTPAPVADYIERHGLYQTTIDTRMTEASRHE